MKKIVVFSGAGLSAESGIPTFRDSGGLWEGQRIEDVAAPYWLEAKPIFSTGILCPKILVSAAV
ncbi:MAG: Sir2 family NAD-dependent protein deacetylase [Potamolinea sp.]